MNEPIVIIRETNRKVEFPFPHRSMQNTPMMVRPKLQVLKPPAKFADWATLSSSVCNLCVRNTNSFYCWQYLPRKRAMKRPWKCVWGWSIYPTSHLVAVPHHDFSSFCSQRNWQRFFLPCHIPFPPSSPVLTFACDHVFQSFHSQKNRCCTSKQTCEWQLPVQYYQTVQLRAKHR